MPRRKVDVENKILEELKKGPLSWGYLLTQTNVSKGALSKYLAKLIKNQIVLAETKHGRPPTTIYRLNTREQFISLALSIVKELPESKFQEFLSVATERVFEIIAEIIGVLVEKGPVLSFDINDVVKLELTKDEIEKIEKELGYSAMPPPKAQKGFEILGYIKSYLNEQQIEEMDEKEQIIKVLNQTTVQAILILYNIEKSLFFSQPKAIQNLIIRKNAIDNFLILPIVFKHKASSEFDIFSKWWYENVAPRLTPILAVLVVGYYRSFIMSKS